MPKATIEVEIPDGYEFVRYDFPKPNEYAFYLDKVTQVGFVEHRHIIVRKVEPVTELAVRFKPGWVAMDSSGDWWWYEEKPYIHNEGFAFNTGPEVLCRQIQMPSVTDWKQSLMRVG